MAEPPESSRTDPTEPVRFAQHLFQVDARSGHLQRLDAQAAVDLARQRNISARLALAAADTAPARVAVDDASSALRAAVGVLTALNHRDGVDLTAVLDVEVDVEGTVVTVRPHGELDLYTSPGLEQVCARQVDGMTGGTLVVDLAAVSFLDSSALAVLVEVHRVCRENRTRFVLTGPTDRTRRLLAITHLDTVLDIA